MTTKTEKPEAGAPEPTHMTMAAIILANLRRAGWTVAVHNDYRQNDQPHTFWLFTHEQTKRYAQGEGASDQEALEICAHEAALVMDAPLAFAEPAVVTGRWPANPGRANLPKAEPTLTQVTPTVDELPGRPWIDLTEARRALASAAPWITADHSGILAALTKQLGDAIRVIEDRFAAPDEFDDAEEAGEALRAGAAAFVGLENFQRLLDSFHAVNHRGLLETCTVEICQEGRGHLPHMVPALKEVPVDPHLLFAAAVYDVHCRDVTPGQREAAKRAGYWLAYGGDPSQPGGLSAHAVLKAAEMLAVPADRVRAAITIVGAQLRGER